MINKVMLTGHCYISNYDDPTKNVVKFQIKQKPFKDAENEYLPCEAWDNKYKQLASQIREHFGESAERERGKPMEIEGRYRARKYMNNDGEARTAIYVEVDRWSFTPRDYSAENGTGTTDNDEASSSEPFPF